MRKIYSSLAVLALVSGCGSKAANSRVQDINSLPSAATGQGTEVQKTIVGIECKTSFNGEERVEKKSLESLFAQEPGSFDFRGNTVWNFAVGPKTFSVNYVVDSEFKNYILLALSSADTSSLDPASPTGMGPNVTVVTSGSGSFDRTNLIPSKTQVVQAFLEIKEPPNAVIIVVSCTIK